MEKWEYAAPCLFGIEGILGDELKRMDAQDVRVQNGRVLFSGRSRSAGEGQHRLPLC